MGEPVYSWPATIVENVLVRPLSPSDLGIGGDMSALRPDGTRVKYRLAFPKSYGGPDLAHARVSLIDRGMDPSDHEGAYRVVGEPDIVRPCPTDWNMYVEVGRVDG